MGNKPSGTHASQRRYDAVRGTRTERGYDNRWIKARAAYLVLHPLCRMCERRGLVELATVVDHIKPHRGDMRLFWNSDNWQGLCTSCHSGAKQAEEKGGAVRGCDANGIPIDPRHPWNT